MGIDNKIENNNPHKNKVHRVLAYSYLVQFALFLMGFFIDLILQFKISTSFLVTPIGISSLILGSLLILWAQITSYNFKKENITKETFNQGPYRYTRSPTHFGLFLLMLGFGVIMNTPFVILFTIISFFVSKFVFLNKQETILAEKYGDPYIEYKKLVKF